MGKPSREELEQALQDKNITESDLKTIVSSAEKLTNDDLTLFLKCHDDKAGVLKEFFSDKRTPKTKPNLSQHDSKDRTPLLSAIHYLRSSYLPIITGACRDSGDQGYWRALGPEGETALHAFVQMEVGSGPQLDYCTFIDNELTFMGRAMWTAGKDRKMLAANIAEQADVDDPFQTALTKEDNNWLQVLFSHFSRVENINIIQLIRIFKLDHFYDLAKNQNKDGNTLVHQLFTVNHADLNNFIIGHRGKLPEHLSIRNTKGETPMHSAVFSGNETLFEFFTTLDSNFLPRIAFAQQDTEGPSLCDTLMQYWKDNPKEKDYVKRLMGYLARVAPKEIFTEHAKELNGNSAGLVSNPPTSSTSSGVRATSLAQILMDAANGYTQATYKQSLKSKLERGVLKRTLTETRLALEETSRIRGSVSDTDQSWLSRLLMSSDFYGGVTVGITICCLGALALHRNGILPTPRFQ